MSTDLTLASSRTGETTSPRTPVTVVTPSYNQVDFVGRTVESVLGQTGDPIVARHLDVRYVVADGNSTDGSAAVLRRYADRLDGLLVEDDRGQSDAIVKAIGDAGEGWFGWINSDDYYHPGTFARLTHHPNADLVAMPVRVVGDGADYVIRPRRLSAAAMLRDDRYAFAQPGLFFKLDRLIACGGIDTNLNYGFDWDLLVRYLADDPSIAYDDHVAATFTVHPQSKTFIETQDGSVHSERVAGRFDDENRRIRDKLDAMLPPRLVRANRLGRRRIGWHRRLVRVLDDYEASPLAASWWLMRESVEDPHARMTKRTASAVIRLMSRYVRPRRSWDKTRRN